MSRIRRLAVGDLSSEQRAVYDAIVSSRSRLSGERYLPGPFNAMLYNPTVGVALQSVGAALRFGGTLPPRAREIATLAVAGHWNCEYEWQSHEALGRELGLASEDLAAIRDNGPAPFADPIERSVLGITRTLLRSGDLSDEDYAEAIAEVGVAGLVEITTLVGYYTLLATQLRVFRVDAADELLS